VLLVFAHTTNAETVSLQAKVHKNISRTADTLRAFLHARRENKSAAAARGKTEKEAEELY